MPVSEYTGKTITEDQKKVEDAWNKKSGKYCNIQMKDKGQNECMKNVWENYFSDYPRWKWEEFDYRQKPEPEKPNLLPWNTDIFNMPGFPPNCNEIHAPYSHCIYGIDKDGEPAWHFDLSHDCTDFENSTLHRPGTEKILPCPLGCDVIPEIDKNNDIFCPLCGCSAPKSSWQKRKV